MTHLYFLPRLQLISLTVDASHSTIEIRTKTRETILRMVSWKQSPKLFVVVGVGVVVAVAVTVVVDYTWSDILNHLSSWSRKFQPINHH